MFGSVEVFGGVFVLGGIATADVATLHAEAQMNPGVSTLDAFGADTFIRASDFHVLQMGAFVCH